MKASQWLTSRCFRSRAGRTVMTLVSVAVLPPTATAKVDETVVTFPAYPDDGSSAEWKVSVGKTGKPGARVFVLRSTAPQRENLPSSRTITESKALPRIVTANPLFDAIFAQAVEEARTNSVSAIQDEAYNRTRFAVICLPQTMATPPATGRDCTSLVVSVPNRPGAMHDLLVPLKKHGVSMTRLESRPARTGQWEYYFYIDLDGHPSQPHVAAALAELRELCAFFKMLGAYPVKN